MTRKDQATLFEPAEIPAICAEPQDLKRLAGQNAEILARLRQGAAMNTELARIALNYTARISDLRVYLQKHTGEWISRIRCHRGLNKYEIVPERPLDTP